MALVKQLLVASFLFLWPAIASAQIDTLAIGTSPDYLDGAEEQLSDPFKLELNEDLREHRDGKLTVRSRTLLDPNARDVAGNEQGVMLGSPVKQYSRIRGSMGSFSAGVLLVKDAWEESMGDRLAGYLALDSSLDLGGGAAVTKLIAGDFSLDYGSGLLFASGGRAFKSRSVLSALKNRSRGIRPYLSSSVLAFQRGAASSAQLGALSLDLFYSERPFDARRDSFWVTSFDEAGYHRTSQELARRNAAHERLFGSHAAYSLHPGFADTVIIGATAFSASTDIPVRQTDGTLISRSAGYALNGHLQRGTFTVSAEGAKITAADKVWNGLEVSTLFQPTPAFGIGLNYRNIGSGFRLQYSDPFGESTGSDNGEEGYYFAARIAPMKGVEIEAYSDLSEAIAATNGLQRATSDYLVAGNFITPDKTISIRATVKAKSANESASYSVAGLPAQSETGTRSQVNARIDCSAQLVSNVRVSAKLERVDVTHSFIHSSGGHEVGLLGYLRGRMDVNEHLRVGLGVAKFSTPSYDSRIYHYEDNLSGAILAFYGKGLSVTINSTLRLNALSLALFYSSAMYSDPRTFGSGVTERIGTSDAHYGFQVDLNL